MLLTRGISISNPRFHYLCSSSTTFRAAFCCSTTRLYSSTISSSSFQQQQQEPQQQQQEADFKEADADSEEEEEDEDTIAASPEDLDTIALPQGVTPDFYIVQEYTFRGGDDWKRLLVVTDEEPSDDAATTVDNKARFERLRLTDTNVTLAVALTMVDPIAYPSLSRARKAIRNGNVLLIRSSDSGVAEGGDDDNNDETNSNTLCMGKAADRVVPFDRICIQIRMGNGTNFKALRHAKPPFDVPVVYEDDHCALVNKPAGVITFRQGSSGNGFLSVRAALPFVLQPPTRGTHAVLRRPASVHRLDKPTSGLLCVVKTKPAMVHMSQQFHDRRVQKTYTAIVNGIPEERSEASVTSEEAAKFGIDPSQYPARHAVASARVAPGRQDRGHGVARRALREIPPRPGRLPDAGRAQTPDGALPPAPPAPGVGLPASHCRGFPVRRWDAVRPEISRPGTLPVRVRRDARTSVLQHGGRTAGLGARAGRDGEIRGWPAVVLRERRPSDAVGQDRATRQISQVVGERRRTLHQTS